MTDAILRLQTLSFEGAGLYRTATERIALSKKGKVLISGEEGSGKSIIPEVMTLILYGKGSPRLRKSGFVESSIVGPTSGYRGELAFSSGAGATERQVNITQAFRHPRLKSRYIITVDGVREEPTTKPEQKKLVKRLAPLSYEEWLGVVYLPQGGIHDLLAGSPTEKRQYLTSAFGLDFYDDLVTEVKEEQKRLEQQAVGSVAVQQGLADVRHQVDELEKQLAALPERTEAEQQVADVQKRLQDLSQELGRLEAASSTVEELSASKSSLTAVLRANVWASASLRDIESDLDEKVASLSAKQVEIGANLREAKRTALLYAKALQEKESREEELRDAEKEKKAIDAKLSSLPGAEPLQRAKELLTQAENLGATRLIHGSKANASWTEAMKLAESLGRQAAQLRKLVTRLSQHNEDGHQTVCPTCSQDVDTEALVSSAERLRQEADEQATAGEAGLTGLLVKTLAPMKIQKIETLADAQDLIDEAMRSHDQAARLAQRVLKLQERVAVAAELLTSMPKPQSTEALEEKLSAITTKLQNTEAARTNARKALALDAEVKALERALGDTDLDGLDEAIVSLRERRDKAQAKYQRAVAVKEQIDALRSDRNVLKKQQQKLEQQAAQQAEQAVLLKGYEQDLVPYFSTLRAAKVKACVSVLESVLPVYVGAMAESQYRGAELRLSVSDDLKDVDLELRAGRERAWTSALQASGGQRRRFTLAIIAALREVSPRRANIMFFDEPFADLQAEGKLLFVNRLIPTLMERCPDLESVFLIAHDAEILQAANDSFDEVWNVSLDQSGSHIATGQKLAMVEGK